MTEIVPTMKTNPAVVRKDVRPPFHVSGNLEADLRGGAHDVFVDGSQAALRAKWRRKVISG